MVLEFFKNDLLTNVLKTLINQTHFYLFILTETGPISNY